MKKFLFDLFPMILFFGAYKFAGCVINITQVCGIVD